MSEVEDLVEFQYNRSNITFSIYVSDSVPEIVHHDSKRIKQICLNLIYNALKFTEKGYVTVVVDCSIPPVKKISTFTQLKQKVERVCNLHFAISDSG